jgi:hypothetical protein
MQENLNFVRMFYEGLGIGADEKRNVAPTP